MLKIYFSRVILGLLGVLLVAQVVACKSDDAMSAVTQADIGAQKASGLNGLGESCVTVKDCPSYLSCENEVCAMPPSLKDSVPENTPTLQFLGPQSAPVGTFYLELAISPDEHEKGLMYRRELPDDWGMLFIYPDEGMRSFWMQNTYIPLDMIFIDARGEVVHFLEEVEPLTRTPRRSERYARYVLELRGGRAAEIGLKVGHRVTLNHVDDKHDVKP
ncbi:DUF192 domain-containing protein [Bradymonas sediminis]|nr:DUF192 domain-containing protein [Bradymonas sediminis]